MFLFAEFKDWSFKPFVTNMGCIKEHLIRSFSVLLKLFNIKEIGCSVFLAPKKSGK